MTTESSKKRPPDRVHTWPHLLRLELLAALAAMIVLIIWSIVVDAPLELPADPNITPNPAKAPWYFLGLQEMLVYFDPWIAGVLVPVLIILGLAAIPYLDVNPRGNGYYTLRERPFAIATFLFGFVVLWVLLIGVGVFVRGPGWNFYAPWEPWDTRKVVQATNVNLWALLGVEQRWPSLASWLGGLSLLLYFVAPPWWLWRRGTKKQWPTLHKLGWLRFAIVSFLFMAMLLLPIKMLLRWTLHIHYLWVWPGVLNV